MDNDFLELIEPTPKIKNKKCGVLVFFISFFLKFSPALFALWAWYLYDYFIAGAVLLITFLIVGIIRSKLRNEVIPANQREFAYTDNAIAVWYVAKRICF
ncbi:hypothetical protein [Sulfurimonas sp. HSL-1716]|uniref:hypothetical protein n=1 Tax=Hydrocurvibacter sulfurireducens TaxID=3131937 RepID=UPI0031F811FB